MPRVIMVGQETGGVGKSTVTRGLAEAVEKAAILELESAHRLIEFPETAEANVPGAVRWFEISASRGQIEASGGIAAREELDPILNALCEVSCPTIIDIGANKAASFFDALPAFMPLLGERSIELAVMIVATADASSLADASKLLHRSRTWAMAQFVVGNEVRGPIDGDDLKKVAGKATITALRRFELGSATRSVLEASALRGIRALDRDALIRDQKAAPALRIIADLHAFRMAVMDAVRPAAEWLIDARSK